MNGNRTQDRQRDDKVIRYHSDSYNSCNCTYNTSVKHCVYVELLYKVLPGLRITVEAYNSKVTKSH